MRLRLAYLTLLISVLVAAFGAGTLARASASALPGRLNKDIAVANNGFGSAVINGPDVAINAYATPTLLSQAPDHHLINLLHLLNIPGSYAWRVNAYDGRSVTVTMSWIFSAGSHTTTINDRLLWTKTLSRWRIAKITYLNTTSV